MESPIIHPTVSSGKTSTSILTLIEYLLGPKLEFDTKALEKLRCWPITSAHYSKFTIKKRNGTERNLVSVNKKLKILQARIAKYLERKAVISKHAHAFVPKRQQGGTNFFFASSNSPKRSRGVISNALPHSNKKVVISIDLKDFFGTITFPRIIGLLKSAPFNLSNKQAVIIASLVCLPKGIDPKRSLPQGAPSSPILSNLICAKIDYQLAKFARKYDIAYTRYADDLTFSTNNLKAITPNKIISLVKACIERNGFVVNEDKIKVMYDNQRQMVAGILVNEGLNLPKKHVDALKATLHNLEHNYKSIDDAILDRGFNSHDSFVPLDYYNQKFTYKVRFVASPNKGTKRHKPASNKEFEWIYAQHILGRILWYGQVVTTGIQDPYDLTQRQSISPKQYSRIIKYEEFLGAFYRIALKFNWQIEHILLRKANKLPTLHTLVNMKPNLLLEPFLPNEEERELRVQASKLKSNKEKYTDFFENSPRSLQRALRVLNRSHYRFGLDKIKKCVETGWPDPIKQHKVFEELNTESLSDIFHKSTNKEGHKVKDLLVTLVNTVKPSLPYLSDNIKKKFVRVHRELLNLIRSEGDSVCIDPENETVKTEQALQAIRDLKSTVRLYEENADNLHNKIVNQALKISGTSNLVQVVPDRMAIRLVTDILAWRSALTKVLMSIKQHMDESETKIDKNNKPFTIKFRDEHPVTGKPRAIEIYRKNPNIEFKKSLDISVFQSKGKIDRWITGGDLTCAVRDFLPIGDIFVYSNFKDRGHLAVNLTEHFYKKSKPLIDANYGMLFMSLEEVKTYS